jgi:hypothetical protein
MSIRILVTGGTFDKEYDELIFGDKLSGPFGQGDQNVECTTTDANRFLAFEQELPLWLQAKGSEGYFAANLEGRSVEGCFRWQGWVLQWSRTDYRYLAQDIKAKDSKCSRGVWESRASACAVPGKLCKIIFLCKSRD